MKKIILYFLVLFIFGCNKEKIVNPAYDYPPQVGEYDLISPYGIDIVDFAINPLNPSEILIGTKNDSLYLTLDYGKNWKKLNEEVWFLQRVQIGTDNNYYSIGKREIKKSTNRGMDWIRIDTTESMQVLIETPGVEYQLLNTNLANEGILFVVTNANFPFLSPPSYFLRSTDAGTSWEITNSTYPAWALSIDCSKKDNVVVYSMSLPNIIYKSTDRGLNFREITGFNGVMTNLALSKGSNFGLGINNSQSISRFMGDKLFLTNDAFETLQEINNAEFRDFYFRDAIIDFTDKVFITVKDKNSDTSFVYYSRDKGQSWQRLGTDGELKTKLGYDPVNRLVYVVKPNKGLYRFKLE